MDSSGGPVYLGEAATSLNWGEEMAMAMAMVMVVKERRDGGDGDDDGGEGEKRWW